MGIFDELMEEKNNKENAERKAIVSIENFKKSIEEERRTKILKFLDKAMAIIVDELSAHESVLKTMKKNLYFEEHSQIVSYVYDNASKLRVIGKWEDDNLVVRFNLSCNDYKLQNKYANHLRMRPQTVDDKRFLNIKRSDYGLIVGSDGNLYKKAGSFYPSTDPDSHSIERTNIKEIVKIITGYDGYKTKGLICWMGIHEFNYIPIYDFYEYLDKKLEYRKISYTEGFSNSAYGHQQVLDDKEFEVLVDNNDVDQYARNILESIVDGRALPIFYKKL